MTPKERAAMQQALEFIVDCEYGKAELALREALAEPDMNLSCKSVQARLAASWGYVKAEQAEQEPVACDGLARACNLAGIEYKDFLRIKAYLPIAAPVRTKDLTDDDIFKTNKTELPDCQDLVDFARAVIAADREKNK